jgi:predicted GIY-YIG superfamily endonuclease
MVYVLHFKTKLKHAGHYIGYAQDVLARLAQHRAGHGARLTQVLNEQGIEYEIALVMEGDRTLERKLKNCKNVKRYCPICSELPVHYHPK